MLRVRGNLICCFLLKKYNKTGSLVPVTLLRNQLWDLGPFSSFIAYSCTFTLNQSSNLTLRVPESAFRTSRLGCNAQT